MSSGHGPVLEGTLKLPRNTWNVLGSVLCYVQTDRNGLFIVPIVDCDSLMLLPDYFLVSCVVLC